MYLTIHYLQTECGFTVILRYLTLSTALRETRALHFWMTGITNRITDKKYISYDSTNSNCQAVDINFVEYGHPKEDFITPVINYSVAYDRSNEKPMCYEIISEARQISRRCRILWKKQAVKDTRMLGLSLTGDILQRRTFTTWTNVVMNLSL